MVRQIPNLWWQYALAQKPGWERRKFTYLVTVQSEESPNGQKLGACQNKSRLAVKAVPA